MAGVVATRYQKSDATLEDVRLELASDARTDVSRVGDLPIQTASGATVPLRSVATIDLTNGPTQNLRLDMLNSATVRAETAVADDHAKGQLFSHGYFLPLLTVLRGRKLMT